MRKHSTHGRIWLAAAAVAFFCIAGFAQEAPGSRDRSVEGIVRDQAGRPVAGAVVQLEDSRTLSVRSFITTKEGKYHFTGLFTNLDYHLRASYHHSFGPQRTLSQFSGLKAMMDLTVPDGG